MKKILLLALGFLISHSISKAQDQSVSYNEKSELEMDAKIKNKQFPGGQDEGTLKIQLNLSQPVRRVIPSLEEGQTEENQERD